VNVISRFFLKKRQKAQTESNKGDRAFLDRAQNGKLKIQKKEFSGNRKHYGPLLRLFRCKKSGSMMPHTGGWPLRSWKLLVAIAVIAVLAAMMLPAMDRAKAKANQITCVSNLKQIGHGLQMYLDDEADQLPGPLWSGMQASYDQNSSEEFMYYIAPYVAAPRATDQPMIAQIAVCSGYLKCAPGLTGMSDMEGRVCYLLNPDADPWQGSTVPPFGYPDPVQMPLKHSQLSQ
jgi:type II secretory pathway pseudopilin PulG